MHMYKKGMQLYTVYVALHFPRFIIQYPFVEFKSSAPRPHTTQYKYVSGRPNVTLPKTYYIHMYVLPDAHAHCTLMWNTAYPSLRMYGELMISITDGDRRTDHFWGTLSYMCLQ